MEDLKEATVIVIADALNNNNNMFSFEQVTDMSEKEKIELARELVESDEFLMRLGDNIESMLTDYFDDFGDEYGVEF